MENRATELCRLAYKAKLYKKFTFYPIWKIMSASFPRICSSLLLTTNQGKLRYKPAWSCLYCDLLLPKSSQVKFRLFTKCCTSFFLPHFFFVISVILSCEIPKLYFEIFHTSLLHTICNTVWHHITLIVKKATLNIVWLRARTPEKITTYMSPNVLGRDTTAQKN